MQAEGLQRMPGIHPAFDVAMPFRARGEVLRPSSPSSSRKSEGRVQCWFNVTEPFSGSLEGSAGSLADLVPIRLGEVDLPIQLLKGGTFQTDEQAAILASRITQEGKLDGGWVAGSSRCDVQLKGSKGVHGPVSFPD